MIFFSKCLKIVFNGQPSCCCCCCCCTLGPLGFLFERKEIIIFCFLFSPFSPKVIKQGIPNDGRPCRVITCRKEISFPFSNRKSVSISPSLVQNKTARRFHLAWIENRRLVSFQILDDRSTIYESRRQKATEKVYTSPSPVNSKRFSLPVCIYSGLITLMQLHGKREQFHNRSPRSTH